MLHRWNTLYWACWHRRSYLEKSDSSYAIFNCRENRERMVTLLHMLLAEADRSLDGCETVCQTCWRCC